MLCLDTLELDSNLFARDDVGSEVDIAEGAASDFSTNTVLVAHAEILEIDVSISSVCEEVAVGSASCSGQAECSTLKQQVTTCLFPHSKPLSQTITSSRTICMSKRMYVYVWVRKRKIYHCGHNYGSTYRGIDTIDSVLLSSYERSTRWVGRRREMSRMIVIL